MIPIKIHVFFTTLVFVRNLVLCVCIPNIVVLDVFFVIVLNRLVNGEKQHSKFFRKAQRLIDECFECVSSTLIICGNAVVIFTCNVKY